ncbi:junctional sarcoplasmic reticulum protein 1 [Melanerpes formicivorus]|uniref:junctional sarcoplasmic reticulum protein 1 n=1 Tax=Melanerpes formicivorus TaxID=211600 RepID=UPI00358EFE57
MAADACEVLDRALGCPEATKQLPGWAGSARRQLRKARTEDAEAPVSSQGQSHGAHEEAGTRRGSCEQDPAEPELSMPEPAPLGGDKRAAEKKRVEKVAAKGSTAGPPVPKSLPVQRKVEPPSLDPAEEPLLWEGLTLNKCILVASIVALLSVTFQVLQAPCSREAVSRGRQDPPAPPLHEVVIAKEKEVVQEVVTAQPPQPASSTLQGGDDDDDEDEDDSDDDRVADSNLAEPWIFKKWFGRSAPEDEDEEAVEEPVDEEAEDEKPGDEEPTAKEPTEEEPTDEEPAGEEPAEKESEDEEPEEEEPGEEEPEDEDEEPTDVPESPPVARKVKKSREEVKVERKVERKAERVRERRAAQAERSGRRQAAAKDKTQRDRAGRAPRAPREPEPQKKRGRERRESRRERAEPRREAGKGRPGRAEAGRESSKRDWRQQKGSRKPWEPAASLGKDPARPREGKRRD